MTASNSKADGQTVRTKSASVNVRDYDEALMHKRFADIAAAIHARPEDELGFHSIDVTPRSLSILTGNLRQFIESALGKDADPSTRIITKFPHKLFMDYKPGGGLDIMLCACLNFKALHGLRRLEFANIERRRFYMDLLVRIEKNLKVARLIPMVKVFIARSVPTSVQPALRAIIQKRGVTVSSASAATHIVYPDPPGTTVEETANTDYCRALEIRDPFALVHWWYHPDSYDSWIPRSDVDGDPEPADDIDGPWHVQIRWLQDTDKFNEWMNEADYEIPEEGRMKVIPAPRAEPPAAVMKEKTPKPELDKASKKRRRPSSTKPAVDSTSDRESRKDTPPKREKHKIVESSDDSEEETIRKPRRNAESSTKERKMRDGTDGGRRARDTSDTYLSRKKARLSDEGRGSSGRDGHQSVKVRLYIKPPHQRQKERNKDRTKDRAKDRTKDRTRDRPRDQRARESAKIEKKEVSSEGKGGTGLKAQLKPARDDASEVRKIMTAAKDLSKDSDVDEASSVKSKLPGGQRKHGREDRKKSDNIDGKQSSPKSAPASSSPEVDIGKDAVDSIPPAEDAAQEQKRPFSRRRSKKKERRQARMPGVSVVDDAVPIPEGEVPRIRNISHEGGDQTNSGADQSMLSRSASDDEMIVDEGNGEIGDASRNRTEKGNAMDVDTGRVMAVSEKMLNGETANAPISGADVVGALPTVTVRVPANARWFRMDAIHDIEKRSLSEFFNNRAESKTPLVYKKYRDFMIDVWRQNPDKYLTATAARRHLAGDVCAILRVHNFLEHWGLINYGVEPESRPHLGSGLASTLSKPKPVLLDGVANSTATGVSRLLFFDEPRPPKRENTPVTLQKAIKSAKEKKGKQEPSILSRRELYATAAATKYECDACGKDCSRMRYHCVGNADIELCPSCFANGMYPEGLSARDFEQLTTVTSSEAYDGSVWSEAEVLLLLEGLEKFGDDWNSVAEHVGTKTNEQCVLQFLRMPIEDSFLGDQLGKWQPGEIGLDDDDENALASGEHKFAGPLLPFADTANPIMAQVAFLASSVSPEVAAAAAQAALVKIMRDVTPASSNTQEKQTALAKAVLQSSSSPMAGANGMSSQNNTSSQGDQADSEVAIEKLQALRNDDLDQASVEAAAAVGLAAAVARAKELADAEMREIEREFAVVVESKLRIVDLKLKEFEGLEQHVRLERARLEKQRQQVYADRVEAAMMRTTGQLQGREIGAPIEASVDNLAVPVAHVQTNAVAMGTNSAAVTASMGGVNRSGGTTFVSMQTDGSGQ